MIVCGRSLLLQLMNEGILLPLRIGRVRVSIVALLLHVLCWSNREAIDADATRTLLQYNHFTGINDDDPRNWVIGKNLEDAEIESNGPVVNQRNVGT